MPEEFAAAALSGPGLAVRILGEITPERLALLRECRRHRRQRAKCRPLYQDLAVICRAASGDVGGRHGRHATYAYTCAIRAVSSEDGMTADWVRCRTTCWKMISSRIVNRSEGVKPRGL